MKRYVLIFTWLLTIGITTADAQDNLKIQTKIPFYIDVNNATKENVYDMYEGFISLQYLDNVGTAKDVELTVFNWKKEVLGTFKLDKTPGLNHYSFELSDMGIQSEIGATYRFLLTNEARDKYEWVSKNSARPKDNPPVPSITVKPVSINCKRPMEGSFIEFYGGIEGGKGPYTLTWYVMNEAKSEFLYQPREERVLENSTVAVISVDKNPAYYVMLLVTDACGNVGKKMVFVSCQEENKRINTIFVEPLNSMQNLQTPIRKETK